MKFRYCLFIFASSTLFFACNNTNEQKPAVDSVKDSTTALIMPQKEPATTQINIPKGAVEGDFDGDGVKEYVWLVAPQLDSSGTDCISGDCTSILKFSNPTIPDIKVEQCIGGVPAPKGDLNSLKGDEIGLLPEWFTSCWSGYKVYTLKDGKWIYAVEPFSTQCNQWQEGVNPIEKDSAHPGKVIIRYSEMTEEGIELKEKSVVIK